MNWTSALSVLKETKTPRGYEIGQLRGEDVAGAIEGLREWYPEIGVGAESCHLTPEFYAAETALAGSERDLPIFPIVAKHGSDIVALITLEKNLLARTITCRLGAIAPAHRGSGLVLLGPLLLENVGRAIGAELAWYVATLKTKHQQVLAERMRYQLVGIVPAFDRSLVAPGDVKRVFEAIYAKVLVAPDAIIKPDDDALTAKTQAVWKALFGGDARSDQTRAE